MPFPTDIFGNCENLFLCAAEWSNTVTYGMYWSLILLAFGVILLMATFSFGFARAFGFATISVAFLSLLLIQIALIPLWVMTLCLILGGIGVAVMLMQGKG